MSDKKTTKIGPVPKGTDEMISQLVGASVEYGNGMMDITLRFENGSSANHVQPYELAELKTSLASVMAVLASSQLNPSAPIATA